MARGCQPTEKFESICTIIEVMNYQLIKNYFVIYITL